MPADHNLGDRDDDTTRPETPRALLDRTVEQFRSAALSISRAVPLLEELGGSEREYFAALLAEDITEFLNAGRDLATYVRSRARPA